MPNSYGHSVTEILATNTNIRKTCIQDWSSKYIFFGLGRLKINLIWLIPLSSLFHEVILEITFILKEMPLLLTFLFANLFVFLQFSVQEKPSAYMVEMAWVESVSPTLINPPLLFVESLKLWRRPHFLCLYCHYLMRLPSCAISFSSPESIRL